MNAVDGGGGASEGSVGSIFGGFFASIFESANKGSGDDEDTADVMFSSDSLVRRGSTPILSQTQVLEEIISLPKMILFNFSQNGLMFSFSHSHPADRGRAEPVRADVAVGALLGRRLRLPLHHLPRQLGKLILIILRNEVPFICNINELVATLLHNFISFRHLIISSCTMLEFSFGWEQLHQLCYIFAMINCCGLFTYLFFCLSIIYLFAK